MLKSCWDCIAGDGARRSEEPYYTVQLNGNNAGNFSSAPPWPTPQLQKEKMYLLPKQLESQDRITINCQTVDQPGQLKIGLVTGSNTPDYSNLACQLEMYLPPHYSDKLTINTLVNGQYELVYETSAVENYEGTRSDFSVSFRMRDNGLMDIHLGDSYLHSMQLVHEAQNIRFLTVSGDIQKVIGLDFKFGNN